MAGGAHLRCSTGGAAGAVAGIATLRPGEVNLLFHAGHGLLEGDGHIGPERGTSLGGVGISLALAAAEAAETPAEEGTEDVSQVDVPHVEAAEAAPAGAEVGVYPRMAELVILGPFLLVGQHLIGLVDLFELSLGFFVARIHVRVVLLGQLPVGFLQFIVRGGAGHPQDFIIASFLFRHTRFHL